MKTGEYNRLRANICKAHNKDLDALATHYALSNNPVEPGDIITDQTKTITVTDIAAGSLCHQPCCFYTGILSDGRTGTIWQTNIRKHVKKGECDEF